MAFVRQKTVKGCKYYQLVRNYREDGKHKQEVLCHLGRHRSLEDAIANERASMERHEEEASYWSAVAQNTKELLLEEYGEELAGEVPSRQQAYFRWRAFWKQYNQEYEYPYMDWIRSSQGRLRLANGDWTDEHKEQGAEWEKRKQPWTKRREAERLLFNLVYDHHDEKLEAWRHEQWANGHRAALNKFLQCNQKPF